MRAAVYLRVSTEEQAKEGFSINAQRERLTKYADLKDWDLFDLYVDEGRSGKSTDRPELQRMLADAKGRKFNVILFFKLDRFTRSVKDLYHLWEELEKQGVDLHSATEPIDTTTPIGRALMGLLGIFAQLERETIAERVGFGMEQMVREGGWHGGPVPYGYEQDGKSLVINQEEAEVVKLIFHKYVSGMGEHRVSMWLNGQGYRKNGELWNQSTMNYLLQNRVYIGQFEWNKGKDDYFAVDNAAPPILDRETFELAQSVRRSRAGLHPRQATSVHIFSGRLVCAKCGAPMKGQQYQRGYAYYLCTAKTRTRTCDASQIPAEGLEKAFLEEMTKWSEQHFDETFAAAKRNERDDGHEEIGRLESELEKIKKRRKKWLMDLGNAVITQEDFREMTDEDRGREASIREQLEQLGQEEITATPYDVAALAKNLLLQWEFAEAPEKKNLVHILTKRMMASYDKKSKQVHIHIEF